MSVLSSLSNKVNSNSPRLDRMRLPAYKAFSQACQRGLSTVCSFKQGITNDPYGWKFAKRCPPSHHAFGRMRVLLATQNALELKPLRALEVAAGGGGLSARLVASGCAMVANDLREEVLRASLRELMDGDKVRVEAGNMFDLSSESIGKFDLILACEVIEHVAHPRELLEHLKHLLNPDGRILLTTPNGSYFRNKLPTYSEVKDFTELEARQFMPDADGHLFLLTPGELCQLAESVGLAVEQLNVWGTPMLTGHAAFRYLAGLPLIRTAYLTELLAQRLPFAGRVRACTALSATLRLS
jgi:2-polyprenyl-6-hydroxyphenyl methylase/3-demethylubiquinone-9 3-methyltransferase